MSLIIIDNLWRHDNDVILHLYKKHFCQSAIVPRNLTIQFQPLNITANKLVKCSYLVVHFISYWTEKSNKNLKKLLVDKNNYR